MNADGTARAGAPLPRPISVQLRPGMPDAPLSTILVRGLGEIGSAVAHRLFTGGYPVVIHQGPDAPRAHRRAMSFADAFFDGVAVLDGVTASVFDGASTMHAALHDRAFVPVRVTDFRTCLADRVWDIVVDDAALVRGAPPHRRRWP